MSEVEAQVEDIRPEIIKHTFIYTDTGQKHQDSNKRTSQFFNGTLQSGEKLDSQPPAIRTWSHMSIGCIRVSTEICNVLSVILIMSISRVPKMSDYLANNPMLGNDMIKRTMARDRFIEILRYFHLPETGEKSPR
ncbi:hypothetical protein AVEN_94752-1 [Araneus ventricosus]|uniref:PiggyBac transposable element-derived protein domain-containing protein n=1 Tax=Araneus ventricosus TaxID=182803 RepID=A0A4Y2CNG9_ARAVE|nr:hypothetical protein AVEN_94752-1 [Araneus ventricosus]